MLSLRRLANNEVNESYIFFCDHFLKCVVGVQRFNRKWNLNLKLSEIATPSDEALALLLLENSDYKWLSEFESGEAGHVESTESQNLKAKYTSAGKEKEQRKGFTKRYGGWKEEGIQRFNKILDMVKADRIKNGKWFDEIMMTRSKLAGAKNKDVDVERATWIRAGNDLFDDLEEEQDDDDDEPEATILTTSIDELEDKDDDDDEEEQDVEMEDQERDDYSKVEELEEA
jgi:hypothetical protein